MICIVIHAYISPWTVDYELKTIDTLVLDFGRVKVLNRGLLHTASPAAQFYLPGRGLQLQNEDNKEQGVELFPTVQAVTNFPTESASPYAGHMQPICSHVVRVYSIPHNLLCVRCYL